jgi:hypothetical protein
MEMKEAVQLTTSDSLEIEPGRFWEIGDVQPAEDSGGREMVRIEMLPGEQGACVLVVPSTMLLKVSA